jgi:hypothetical protein
MIYVQLITYLICGLLSLFGACDSLIKAYYFAAGLYLLATVGWFVSVWYCIKVVKLKRLMK